MPDEGSPQTDFAITENAATRATKVIGFDTLGAIELQTGAGNWEGTLGDFHCICIKGCCGRRVRLVVLLITYIFVKLLILLELFPQT